MVPDFVRQCRLRLARFVPGVNGELVRFFEGRDRLTLSEAIPAFLVMLGSENARGYTPAFTGERAGTLLSWGVHLGLLTEAVERGSYVWTMPDREPWYVLDEKLRPRQVRGLSDGAAADLARKDATLARLRTTLRTKEAARVGPLVEADLNALLRWSRDYVIRPMPEGCPYPESEFAHYLPTLTLPVLLVEVLPIVREAHLDMEPQRQRRWLRTVRAEASRARWPAVQAVPPAPQDDDALSDEDAAALGDLA